MEQPNKKAPHAATHSQKSMCKFNFYHFNAYNIAIKRQKKATKKVVKNTKLA